MRNILIFVLSASVLIQIASTAKSESHDTVWGARGTRDVLLSRQIVKETAKAMRIISNDHEFRQKPDGLPHLRTITEIVITDQYKNGNGGYATLKSGGPSTDFAVIHLKSQRGHGYHFIIDVYGQ